MAGLTVPPPTQPLPSHLGHRMRVPLLRVTKPGLGFPLTTRPPGSLDMRTVLRCSSGSAASIASSATVCLLPEGDLVSVAQVLLLRLRLGVLGR